MITPESLGGEWRLAEHASGTDLNAARRRPRCRRCTQPALEAALEAGCESGAEIRGVDFYDDFADNGMTGRQCLYIQKYYPGTSCETAKSANANALSLGHAMPFPLPSTLEDIRIDLVHTIFLSVTLHEIGPQHGVPPQLPRLV